MTRVPLPIALPSRQRRLTDVGLTLRGAPGLPGWVVGLCLDLGVLELESLSRKDLLALLAARDERIDALLAMVGGLTAQVQALVLRLGVGDVVEAAVLGWPGSSPAGWVVAGPVGA